MGIEIADALQLDASIVTVTSLTEGEKLYGWWLPTKDAVGAIAFFKWNSLDTDRFSVDWEGTNDPAALMHPNPDDDLYPPQGEFGKIALNGCGFVYNSHFVGYTDQLRDASDVSVLRAVQFPESNGLLPFLAVRPVVTAEAEGVDWITVQSNPFAVRNQLVAYRPHVETFSCGDPVTYESETVVLPWVNAFGAINISCVMRSNTTGATVALHPVLSLEARDRYYSSKNGALESAYGWAGANLGIGVAPSPIAGNIPDTIDHYEHASCIYSTGSSPITCPFPYVAFEAIFDGLFEDVEFTYYITR